MLNAGIIGCGKIAEVRHGPEYSENPETHILGYYDKDPARAQLMADMFGGRVYASIEQMLADQDIDIVSVCVANHAHAQVSIDALFAGKHVLCEKPMATTLAECQAMVDAAHANRRRLMLGHNQRFASAHVMARLMIQDGLIGRPLSFHTTFGHPGPEGWTGQANSWFFSKQQAAFGVLADLGIHKTDLIHYLLGEPIVRVTSLLATLDKHYPDGKPIDVDDNAICLFQTKSGALGTLTASWTYYAGENNATRIYGTKGQLRLYDDPRYAIIYEPAQGKVQRHKLDEMTSNKKQTSGKRTNTGVIDAFVTGVMSGKPTVIDGDEALKAMKVIFAALDSVNTGKLIQVEQA